MNAVSPVLGRTRSPHEAFFQPIIKPIKRSEGRSVVAAALYRAGEKGTDERIGKEFDYTRKRNIVTTFIVGPPDAPEWAYDRVKLWNAVEKAEKRPDAQLGREVLLPLPRELPRESWEPMIRKAIEPYVKLGCVVDCAIHDPDASDGDENCHAHILITPRAIGPEGFARTKCLVLDQMFSSGGRYGGGKRGDAMEAERARWASEVNTALYAVGSTARADHRSRKRRGAADQSTEPTYGEIAAARYRRTRKPSRNQQLVALIRARRRAEQLAISTEIAMEHAVQRTSKIPYAQPKQEIKESLLRERFPDLDTSRLAHGDIYRVDISSKTATKVMMRDNSMVEVRGGKILLYGPDGTAQQLAEALADAQGWERDTISRLPPSARAQAQPGSYRRRQTKEEIERLVAYWQEQGYADVTASPKGGVWVVIGNSRLFDRGDRMSLYGSVTPDALAAMVSKAKNEWSGRLEIVAGSDDFRAKLYLEAQRQGVEVVGYEPPEHVKAQAAAEAKQRGKTEIAVATVADRAAEAREVLRYVRGDITAPNISPEMEAYLRTLMDKKGQFDTRGGRALANLDTAQLVPLLADMEAKGKALLEEQAATVKPAVPAWVSRKPDPADRLGMELAREALKNANVRGAQPDNDEHVMKFWASQHNKHEQAQQQDGQKAAPTQNNAQNRA